MRRAASVRPEPGSNSPSRSRPPPEGGGHDHEEPPERHWRPATWNCFETSSAAPRRARRGRPHWLLASLFRFQGAAARRQADRRPQPPAGGSSGGHPLRVPRGLVRHRASVSSAPAEGRTLRRADPSAYGSDCFMSNGSGAPRVPDGADFLSQRARMRRHPRRPSRSRRPSNSAGVRARDGSVTRSSFR